MKTCPQCQALNPPDANFCTGCRAPLARAAASGVEALVIPDLPLDEAATPDFPPSPPAPAASAVAQPSSPAARALAAQAAAAQAPDGGLVALAATHGVSLVPMATPTSTDARLDLVAAAATSFVYCVAVTGVTGARTELASQLPGLLLRLRARTQAPLTVGFGISTPQQAAAVASLADGVIIGSALIDAVARAAGPDAACRAAAGLIQSASAAIASG